MPLLFEDWWLRSLECLSLAAEKGLMPVLGECGMDVCTRLHCNSIRVEGV